MSRIVTYDAKSFIIDGKRIFLNSGSIHYFRLPKEEWREALTKAKFAGLNCIDTYFAWNFHEENEGEWDFSGDKDCGEFLRLCAELNLYVIARPGPYICAEWDFGGFPWWLSTKEDIQYRIFNTTYLKYVNLYMDNIIPIIAKYQISNGGSVILVQVENEYAAFQDDSIGKPYLDYLRDGISARGIDVPLISCIGSVENTIECSNFWSWCDDKIVDLREKQPDCPKIVTEFWSGWFENWGGSKADRKTPPLLEKRMMEAVRAGFSGINHYMFFGGTNFGNWGGRTVGASDIFMTTSYDYDAPLNEYCCTTPKYNVVKRISYFLNTISDFLLESTEVDSKSISSDKCTIRERTYGSQKLFFVESHHDERMDHFVTSENGITYKITLNPGQIAPLLIDYQLTENIKMLYNSYLYGFEKIDGINTLVIHADNGQRSQLTLNSVEEISYKDELPVLFQISSDKKTISFDFCHFNDAQVFNMKMGNVDFRVIVLNTETTNKSWWLDSDAGKQLRIDCDDVESIALKNWMIASENISSNSSTPVDAPIDFSTFQQGFGYLVYTTEIESKSDRTTTIVIPCIHDTARVYLNGKEISFIRKLFSTSIEVTLQEGKNELSFLIQNMGRYNFSRIIGEPKGLSKTIYIDGNSLDLRRGWKTNEGSIIDLEKVVIVDGYPRITKSFKNNGFDKAILVGTVANNVWINGNKLDFSEYIQWWKYNSFDISEYLINGENIVEMEDFMAPLETLEIHLYKSSDALQKWSMNSAACYESPKSWAELTSVSKNGPSWYKCNFIKPTIPENMNLKIKTRVSGMGKGCIYVNCINIGRYWQIGPQEDYKIPCSWLKDENELVIFDEEGRSPRSIRLLWEETPTSFWE